MPVWVSLPKWAGSFKRETFKSPSLYFPSAVIKIFYGFISRCKMLWECKYSIPLRILIKAFHIYTSLKCYPAIWEISDPFLDFPTICLFRSIFYLILFRRSPPSANYRTTHNNDYYSYRNVSWYAMIWGSLKEAKNLI